MARPKKYNLQYFPLDVNFFEDHKILMIEEDFGLKGGYIALRLLAMIYEQGYYLEWKDKFEVSVARRLGNGFSGAFVMDVLKSCMKHEFFDRTLFDGHVVLSSRGIQKRWLMVMTQLRRKPEINSAFWLIDSEEMPVSSEETTAPSAFSTQKESKVNERKLKKRKSKHSDNGSVVPAEPSPQPIKEKFQKKKFVEPTRQEARIYFISLMGDPKKQKSWPVDKCEFEADKFIDHYISNGWVQGKGKKPIVDWKAAMRNWVRNGIDGTFSGTNTTVNGMNGHKNETMHAKSETKIQLPQVEKEINYRYERFLEGEQTIFNIEVTHYNFLKSRSLISFSDLEKENIKTMAVGYIKSESLSSDENNILKFMKLFGVIEFFKQQAASGNKTIFHADKKRTAEVAS
jgi:hypothetical protein